jgi:hypothetical protein
MSKSQSNCVCDNNNDNNNNNNNLSVNGSARADTKLGENESICKNDVIVGDGRFRSSVMSDLILPKFNYCKRQQIVNFLEELYSYFQLKDVPAEMKLPIAMKSVTDECTQQWVITIYK